jgi:hypothetical protein
MTKSLISLMMFGLIAAIAFTVLQAFGPRIEVWIKAPLNSLTFDEFTCQGDDVVASGVLDKAAYGTSRDETHDTIEAQFLGLTLLTPEVPRQRLAWGRINADDQSPESRPAGIQLISIKIVGGCGVPFYAYTRHESPITGWVLPMSFGPFNE